MILNFVRKIAHRGVMTFVSALPGAFCMSLEVFLRRRFGERYLSWGTVAVAFFGVFMTLGFVGAFYHIVQPVAERSAARTGTAESLWMLAFWSLCIWHKAVIWGRNRRGEQWFSYSPGDAYPIWRAMGISETTTFRIAEPLAALIGALAFAVLGINGFVGLWLFVSGLFLLVKRQLQYHSERRTVLDMIDSRTRSERLRTAMGRQSPHEQSDGYTVTPAATYLTPELREELMRRYGPRKSQPQTKDNA